MGNTHTLPWNRPLKSTEASDKFHTLDVQAAERLTLKELMAASDAGITVSHSLPALYFFDTSKDGALTETEFVNLLDFCNSEKRKVEEALDTDKSLRDLILRASRAGVNDGSVHGRSSFRRFSSYSNVRSVFSSSQNLTPDAPDPPAAALEPPPAQPPPLSHPPGRIISRSPSESSEDGLSTVTHVSHPTGLVTESPVTSDFDDSRVDDTPAAGDVTPDTASTARPPLCHSSAMSSSQQESDEHSDYIQAAEDTPPDIEPISQPTLRHSVAMYSSQREFDAPPNENDEGDLILSSDLKDPRNITALDAAVLENIMHASIHRLADLLRTEGAREQFMAWLWELANFNSSGVVTLEELRVFLAALSEDGIHLEEFVFYKEVGLPMEECIMNEFDSGQAGFLSHDEFMVLADLVTREYEFWENRHLERIGDYELGRTIGRGSSGVVRLAMHVESRKKVAIKIIKKGKCCDLSRLDREIQSLMAAKHKHIVALEEVLDSEASLFIVMELCGGGSLIDIVRLYPEDRMPEETVRFFMRQVFEALAFCHRNGICHRDVRLENLLLDNTGNVKVTDFGHSGLFNPGWDLFSTSLVGSVVNLCPEQIDGQLYSGEKLDVWSAGVAVYCLLVGEAPFLEAEVSPRDCEPLFERIRTCNFKVPDYLSPKAKDLLHCMIRAVPEERITIQQMLHHPWFYDGPEYGPSMNVVVIPVDRFFTERPDIAEMIMAITIYQHNLHFHLAGTQNPKSSPEDQRGQEWTLKCLCPRNDIKFKVSLFTKEPSSPKVIVKGSGYPSATASHSALPNIMGHCRTPPTALRRIGSAREAESRTREQITKFSGTVSTKGAGISPTRNGTRLKVRKASRFSTSKPPLQKRFVKITPLNIAAHIRERGPHGAGDDYVFDFESEGPSRSRTVVTSEHAAHPCRDVKEISSPVAIVDKEEGHSRSHSLDGRGGVMRINRSATVDAFPYQKVYPQREMPDGARHLNFDKPDALSEFGEQVMDMGESSVTVQKEGESSTQLHRFHRSVTLHAVSSFKADAIPRSPGSSSRDSKIAQFLSRHPSKAVSPQSPQVRVSPHEIMLDSVENLSLTPELPTASQSQHSLRGVSDLLQEESTGAETASSAYVETDDEDDDFQPYLEVRLQDGESGLFLKICRKLKNICTTKLVAAAERHKKKAANYRKNVELRRSQSESSSSDSESSVGGVGASVGGQAVDSSMDGLQI